MGYRQSDSFIVLKKAGNAAGGKGLHKITLSEDTSAVLRERRNLMETKLERIADKSAHMSKPEFTSLFHLMNAEMLKQCHKELDGNKAVGIDEVTKEEEYGRNLDANVTDLVERLKRKAYKPQPATRGIHTEGQRQDAATGNCVL